MGQPMGHVDVGDLPRYGVQHRQQKLLVRKHHRRFDAVRTQLAEYRRKLLRLAGRGRDAEHIHLRLSKTAGVKVESLGELLKVGRHEER